ncbi:MAG: alkaline phosphatase D family protein [bacterium]|nr:alkaline phosphatase D family protein [bacterium]
MSLHVRPLTLGIALLVLLVALPAAAADRLLEGTTLRLRQRPAGSLHLRSHDATIAPPTAPPGDGELWIATGAGVDLAIPLPASGWRPVRTGGYRFRSRALRSLLLAPGRLRIVGKGVRLDLAASPKPVDVVLRLGDERFCFRFGGRTVHRPGVRFRADAAPAPASCGAFGVDAGPDRSATACETVTLAASVGGDVASLRWEAVTTVPPVALTASGATAVVQAPAVAVPTDVHVRVVAIDRNGNEAADEVTLTVQPAPREAGLANGMAPDCAPFRHGVASGDPRADGVVLWTRLTPGSGAQRASATWEMAADAAFATPVAGGVVETDADRDFTVKVDVGGLAAATTYWYRFRDAQGRVSAPGRTRTAPLAAGERLRFAVASCSSIYSGYFNAYRRIAERTDLDLVIHLGDYLYDFVDPDEQVRVPTPFPAQPADLAEWRARHAYYLFDPDLRWARARHPWAVVWDNHDVEYARPPDYEGSVQAFREWIPLRDVPPARPETIYRTLAFGPLADVLLLDTLLHRNQELVPGTLEPSILGSTQFDWLAAEVRRSTAAWRILGSQKLVATARVNPDFTEIFDGERRDVFDRGSWDGFPADRTRVFALLGEQGDDNVAVSGDSHISIAGDLVDDPANPDHPYDPTTSNASVGVELLPTSISRGNFDEALGAAAPPEVYAFVIGDTLPRNPHARYLEITRHGYGILDITAERVIGEIWYSPILTRADDEELGVRLTIRRGTGRWER